MAFHLSTFYCLKLSWVSLDFLFTFKFSSNFSLSSWINPLWKWRSAASSVLATCSASQAKTEGFPIHDTKLIITNQCFWEGLWTKKNHQGWLYNNVTRVISCMNANYVMLYISTLISLHAILSPNHFFAFIIATHSCLSCS